MSEQTIQPDLELARRMGISYHMAEKLCAPLYAEIERLRVALEQIGEYRSAWIAPLDPQKIARKALKGSPSDSAEG